MHQTERIEDLQEALRTVFEGSQAGLWTAMPGIVQSFNAARGTCVIQPAVKARIQAADGSFSWQPMFPLPDVKVVFLGCGNLVLTFEPQPGDEALVIFSSRCLDGWWQQGGVQIPPEIRMHDLSDGFAIIGPRSQAKLIQNISPNAQLRTLDGSAYYELTPAGVANIVAPGGVNINGVAIDVHGNVSTPGKVTATGEGTFNTIEVSQHEHTGVTPGSGTTGPPVG